MRLHMWFESGSEQVSLSRAVGYTQFFRGRRGETLKSSAIRMGMEGPQLHIRWPIGCSSSICTGAKFSFMRFKNRGEKMRGEGALRRRQKMCMEQRNKQAKTFSANSRLWSSFVCLAGQKRSLDERPQ